MKKLVPVYATTLLAGAFLLFLVQPMVGKMLLAPLGGSPAVWTTCMVFFQFALLAGYSYAHLSLRVLGAGRQALLSLVLVVAAAAMLPLVVGQGDPNYQHPNWWLLTQLLTGAGFPFFAVAIGAPTLQSWFAALDHPDASDPYFLYAASNTGSLLALLGYPLLVEPLAPLQSQSEAWAIGYLVWAGLMAACAVLLWTGPRRPLDNPVETPRSRAGAGEIGWWVALAFVPSSLMLGVTTFMTHDIAAVPLLWVIPLALYLLTFIVVFRRRPLVSNRLLGRLFPYAVLLMLVVTFGGTVPSVHLLLFIPLAGFFCIALVCHTHLYRRRPPAGRLTEFYFWLAAGGALGGLFNAILAPLIFDSVAEYPLVILLSCLLLAIAGAAKPRKSDLIAPAVLLAVAALLEAGGRASGLDSDSLRMVIAVGIVLVVFSWRDRSYRFTLGVLALVAAGSLHARLETGSTLYEERNFFGIKRVVEKGELRMLLHGNTLHGAESTSSKSEPLAYYSRTGPLGDFFATLPPAPGRRLAGVGLGAGSLASYAANDETVTFFEIDPTIGRLARDRGYFSFVGSSPADVDIVIGDGRLLLTRTPPRAFDVIVLDAFSSDSVPTHLLTVEALELYLSRLEADGLLVFHISNRYLDLRRLIGNLAAHLELSALIRRDETMALEEGLAPSTWVVMAPDSRQLQTLSRRAGWSELSGSANGPVWTDQFSNLLELLNW